MNKLTEHWIVQSEYDFDTAKTLRNSKRNVYAVYLCHLALEKALKGFLCNVINEIPPKTHSLVLLINKIGIKPPEEVGKFILQLNDASVATRYPEDFSEMLETYNDALTDSIIINTEKALQWIKQRL
jgi:HEPN domain-containing protein